MDVLCRCVILNQRSFSSPGVGRCRAMVQNKRQRLRASRWNSRLIIDAERQMLIDISTRRCHGCHRSSTVPLTIVDRCQYQGALPLNHTEIGLNLFQAGECNTAVHHFHFVIIPCTDCEVSRHNAHSY